MFLTPEQLFTLTGRKQAPAQCVYLRSRRIRHYVNARGRVVVKESWLDAESAAELRQEPNFAVLRIEG